MYFPYYSLAWFGKYRYFCEINEDNMRKIGLLSDTHAYWDDKYAQYFSECDEIWHAGDIGSEEVAQSLAAL